MKTRIPPQPGLRWHLAWMLLLCSAVAGATESAASDPLPSWAEGAVKQSIADFVRRVTTTGSKDFVPIPERVAVFDNDGTLWAEQPIYPQMVFVADRVRALAPQFPGWRTKQPFKAAIEGDFDALARGDSHALMQLVMATHAGLTTGQFDRLVAGWMASARHPRFHRHYTDLAYVPMLELLAYLRANNFKTWIVSGEGTDFLRVWAERVYGVPPEQIIGSSLKTQFEISGDQSVLVTLPQIDFINNKAAKPVAIQRIIGRRPILAVGNSDGDLQMLQWTSTGPGPRLSALIHHTDGVREWAYDRSATVGRLDAGLREARRRNWTIVEMGTDWKRIFAF